MRIGSNTKMYVATIVLQIGEEGSVEPDEPIETYLPGLVTGEGIVGANITVRALLQHTSGLPEYANEIAADAFAVQKTYLAPRELLDVALEKPAVFQSGERWEYSNTNYLVLGLLIENRTSRVLHEQIQERIIDPLGLVLEKVPTAVPAIFSAMDLAEYPGPANKPRRFHHQERPQRRINFHRCFSS